jgi:hypothetical protein
LILLLTDLKKGGEDKKHPKGGNESDDEGLI